METILKLQACVPVNDYLAELLDVLFVDMLNDADASWERLSLLDIASYKNGLAMQKFRPAPGDPGLPVLKIKELGQGVCTPDSERCASTIDESVKIHDGNLVFSWSGTLLLDFWAGGDAGLNQHLFKVTSDRYPSWLYYLWTKHHMDRFIMLAKDRATTMGHIKRSALAESEVLIPPVEQLEVLTRRMQPIVDELVVNKIQSRNLAGLRDVLLPKLMSGEIDVSNVRLSMPPNNHLPKRWYVLLQIQGHPYIPATAATAVTQACVGTMKDWYFLEFGTTLGPPGGPFNEKGHRHKPMTWCYWSRGADLNHRPSGYEPDELTRLLHPAMYVRNLFTMGKAARKDITLPTI